MLSKLSARKWFFLLLSALFISACGGGGGTQDEDPADSTPNTFSFAGTTEATLDTWYESPSVTIADIDTAVTVTISGGEYSLAGGEFTSANGRTRVGQTLVVRVMSSSEFETETSATVTVGGVSTTFSVTTYTQDITPEAFSFAPRLDAELSTQHTSNLITVSGINSASEITIVGGEYSIAESEFTPEPGTVLNGQTLFVRLTSSSEYSTEVSSTLTVGGVSAVFSVTTVDDTTPNEFSFTPKTQASWNTQYESEQVIIDGINVPVPISITGGEYSIDGGDFVSIEGTISNGQALTVRLTSSTELETQLDAVVSVGDITGAYSVATAPFYFMANDTAEGKPSFDLWKTNGAAEGTVKLVELNIPFPDGISNTVELNGKSCFLVGEDKTNAIWSSDGTGEGTQKISGDLVVDSDDRELVKFGDSIFFAATNGGDSELWKTDGTVEGTVLVKNINPSRSSTPSNFVEHAGLLYFSATISELGAPSNKGLWATDGSTEGTALVRDISDVEAASISDIRKLADQLYLRVRTESLGTELWISDGTGEGTSLLKDINAGSSSSSPSDFVEFNGSVYFQANDGVMGAELWKTNGTSEGTVLVADIHASDGSSPTNFVVLNNSLLFSACDEGAGCELRVIDITETVSLVKDIVPGASSAIISEVWSLAGEVLFSAYDVINGFELWRSDGTPEGTAIVIDLYAGADGGFPELLFCGLNECLFSGKTELLGRELWKTDLSGEGAQLVLDIAEGASFGLVANVDQ